MVALENLNSDKRWDISMDVSDTMVFRGGSERPNGNLKVIVDFSKEDIKNIGKDCRIRKNSRNNALVKDCIIDWSARAAGALNEAEFYCSGINVDVDEKGDILRGETIFCRRYML
jgi:hypothetical protein